MSALSLNMDNLDYYCIEKDGTSSSITEHSTMWYKRKYSMRIQELEDRVRNLSNVKHCLQRNSNKVKQEIQDHISHQIEHLRQREFLLWRQVEALNNHQNALVQEQLSKVQRMLGRYCTAVDCLQDAKDFQDFEVYDKEFEEILKLLPCQKLKFSANTFTLDSEIRSFGRVEASGMEGTSTMLLLPDEEDYGDGDHHILHKSLNGQCPKRKSLDIEWEPREDSWYISKQAKSAVSSSDAGSFEILSHGEKMEDIKGSCSCCNSQNAEIENVGEFSCSAVYPSKFSPRTSTTSQWLQKCDPEEQPKCSLQIFPNVKKVCKANEKCNSFSNCLCDENCLVSCLKEQLKTSEHIHDKTFDLHKLNEVVNEVIQKNSGNRQVSNNKWLATCPKPYKTGFIPNLTRYNWLSIKAHNSLSKTGKLRSVELKQNYKIQLPDILKSEQSIWLAKTAFSKDVAKTTDMEKNVWLSPTQIALSKSHGEQHSIVKDMFGQYFEPQGSNKWLKKDNFNISMV